jgi:hypothetical protein
MLALGGCHFLVTQELSMNIRVTVISKNIGNLKKVWKIELCKNSFR